MKSVQYSSDFSIPFLVKGKIDGKNVLSSSYTVNLLYNDYCLIQRLDAVCVQIICLNL